jgi:hypothetical protein
MLGLLLIYFIWKQFADLATRYNKSRWGFGILGVVVYYGGVFCVGIILGIFAPDFVDSSNNFLLGLLAIPFGILFCVILYYILKKIWDKEYVDVYNDIDSIGENPQQSNSTSVENIIN